MTAFTVTLTYPGGQTKVAWAPRQPTTAEPCQPGDTIAFVSPNVRSVVMFGIDSPIEEVAGPKGYEVLDRPTSAKAILMRAKNKTFNFSCSPNGVIVPGSGGTVPVGGGDD